MFTPKFLANESITVHIASGYDENGDLNIVQTEVLKARIEQTNEIAHLADGSKATLRQKAFVCEGINNLPTKFDGKVVVNGEEYIIAATRLALNPNGTRNHFVLEMM